MPERTLYVSDLDGTLLGRDSRLSAFTIETLERLVSAGMLSLMPPRVPTIRIRL